jgi:hypothetical protein
MSNMFYTNGVIGFLPRSSVFRVIAEDLWHSRRTQVKMLVLEHLLTLSDYRDNHDVFIE